MALTVYSVIVETDAKTLVAEIEADQWEVNEYEAISADQAAQQAAAYNYDNCDGWEWMRNGYCAAVRDPLQTITYHSGSMEFEPVFHVGDAKSLEELEAD